MKNIEETFLASPTFPDKVYDNLPPFLKDLTDLWDDKRDKDIILLSALIILSGCFSNITGVYGHSTLYASLFAFIVAPPSSNKGIISFCKRLGNKIHNKLVETHKPLKAGYDLQIQAYKREAKFSKVNALVPIKPDYPTLFIPGNISSTKLYMMVNENKGTGVIFETEADTLSGALKQDWGNHSDFFSSNFHHERVSLGRVGGDVYIEVEKPHISMLLSGTPEQVPKLISSTSDGLMSRNIFYCYSIDSEWKSQEPDFSQPSMDKHFADAGLKVYDIKEILDKVPYTFQMTSGQFQWHTQFFSRQIRELTLLGGTQVRSLVTRMGVIAFRVAMILTVLRKKEVLSSSNTLVAEDADVLTSLRISRILLKHSMIMFDSLPNEQRTVSSGARGFFESLPQERFPRKVANEIGEKLKISEKTVGNYLTALKEKKLLLDDDQFGWFVRPEK